MAQRPNNAVPAALSGPPAESTRLIGGGVPPESPLLRFRLRHLLVFVAAVSIVLAGIVSLPGVPALALLLAALVVTFHVLGTALGSELRLRASRNGTCKTASVVQNNVVAARSSAATHCREMAQLHPPWYGRSGATFAWLPRFVAGAAFFGGCLGGLLLTATIGDRTSVAGLILGTASLAAISGWLAFLAGSFYGIVRHGFREAADEDELNQAHRPDLH